jgi:tetratricopeptide (TPR) repeat protein
MIVDSVTDGRDTAPYVGPRPFNGEESHRFHGRSAESKELADLWQTNRLTVVHGEPGAGKTSLLQAGVVPRLEPTQAIVLPVGRVSHRSAFPTAALPEHNPLTFALLSSWDPGESPSRLSNLTISDFLRRHERTDRHGEPMPTLVAIDQAEGLFREPEHRSRARSRFFDELAEALRGRPRTHLLLSIRTAHLDALLPFVGLLGDASPKQFRLPPLSRDAAIDAVRWPAEHAGRLFEPGAAEQLVDELRTIGEPGTAASSVVEPVLLQVVCRALWTALPESTRIISRQLVQRYDTDRVLTGFCDRVVAAVAADHDLSAGRLASWLKNAFITALGSAAAVPEGTERTAGMANRVARALEDRHLLKSRMLDGVRAYELQHPRLVAPIRQLGLIGSPTGLPDPAEHLRAAEEALADGDLHLAQRYAELALALRDAPESTQLSGRRKLRIQAEAESFLGNIAHERGLSNEAVEHYRAAANLFETLQDTPAVGRLLAAVGRLLLAQGELAKAVTELRAAAGRMPNDLSVQTGLGQALWQAGQPQAALAVLSGVLTINGDTPEALGARGEILADLGDAESALRDLDRVRPDRPATRAARALALAALERLDDARLELDDVVADAADSGPVLLRAARVHELTGDPDTATTLASQAVAATHPRLSPHQRDQAVRLLTKP